MSLDDTQSPFDEIIERRGTRSLKWDEMERFCGVSPEDGLAMWVADSDFRAAPPLLDALRRRLEDGILAYQGSRHDYTDAICWWLENRHGWTVDPGWIIPLHGLGNALSMAIDVFTAPGDGVVIFSPVYHEFATKIRKVGRQVVECPLVNLDGRYQFDFDAYDAQMTGNEKLILLSSPHNPGGRVWTADELRGLAAFAQRHDLILVSDEVHQDLVYPGSQHLPMAVAAPEIIERLVTLVAASKTFNTAGLRIGNALIEHAPLRKRFNDRVDALSLQPNVIGMDLTAAAYSPAGAEWVDAQVAYLDGNRRILDGALDAIPGVRSMPLEATFLGWVDFSGTGMDDAEIARRVEQDARIAVNRGPQFGTGGSGFLRFNFATARARVEEAAARLKLAFGDLQ